MEKAKLDELIEHASVELTHQLREYLQALSDGTKDPEHFMTMTDIEDKLYKARSKANKSYLDVTNRFINELDERRLIKIKKENTKKRG